MLAVDCGALSQEDFDAAKARLLGAEPGATAPVSPAPAPAAGIPTGPETEPASASPAQGGGSSGGGVGGGLAAALAGSGHVQKNGKGDFSAVSLSLPPGGPLAAGDALIAVRSASVSIPKSSRKGHPHSFRLDAGGEKFVFSVASAPELAQWMGALQQLSGMSEEQVAGLKSAAAAPPNTPAAPTEAAADLEKLTTLSQSLTGKEASAVAKLLTSSLDRKFIHEGVLNKQGDVKISPRYFFLFSDLMLFCRFNEKKGKATTYEPRRVIPVEELKQATINLLTYGENKKQVPPHKKTCPHSRVLHESPLSCRWQELGFSLKTPTESTTLFANTAAERDAWVAALKATIMSSLGTASGLCAYGDHHRYAAQCKAFLHSARRVSKC